jgi:hypothetical protein
MPRGLSLIFLAHLLAQTCLAAMPVKHRGAKEVRFLPQFSPTAAHGYGCN